MIISWKSPFRFIAAIFRAGRQAARGRDVIASTGTISSRLEECEGCAFYDEEDGQCRVCTCFVSTKVILNSEKCPKGFWDAVR